MQRRKLKYIPLNQGYEEIIEIYICINILIGKYRNSNLNEICILNNVYK